MKNVYIFFVFILLFMIFRNWFITPQVIGGDWPYFFQQRLEETSVLPPSWNTFLGNGFGGISPLYSLQFFHHLTIAVSNIFHIPWEIVYKVLWFGLFLFISFISPIYLFRTIKKKLDIVSAISAGLIYTTNTYVLMVVGGGQMGVGLGYAICPLVVGVFIKLIDSVRNNDYSLSNSLLAGLVLALQVMFDPRISYISMLAVVLYSLISWKKDIRFLFSLVLFVYILPLIITLLLHTPWLLPIFFFHTNPTAELGSAYTGVRAFTFFSFADFSHSFSLLQPNWPENIFGKTSFLIPQFLLLPIIVYSGLFFIKKNTNRKILFFCLLGLMGTFLAKGANQPFGMINSWMFEHIPGFVLFRDSTKFYTLIALSYALLIPYTLLHLDEYLGKLKHDMKGIYPSFFVFIFLWVYLIAPAVLGQIDKTLAQNQSVPREYTQLEKYIGGQPEFFRTLWIPREQRFSFVSDTHPAIEAQPLLKVTNSSEVIAKLQKENTEKYLQNLGIKYVIVPYDPYGEVFFKDRKYDKQQYQEVIQSLRKITWLDEVRGFGNIVVFKLAGSKNHFSLSGNGKITANKIRPDEYVIHIVTKKPTNIIFVESYNPSWVMKINGKEIASQKNKDGLNAFFIKKAGDYTGSIYFKQKEVLLLGWYIAGGTFLAIMAFFYVRNFRNAGGGFTIPINTL